MTGKSIRRSISLTEYEDNIISNLSKVTGINNYSVALRLIIREWDRDHGDKISISGKAEYNLQPTEE